MPTSAIRFTPGDNIYVFTDDSATEELSVIYQFDVEGRANAYQFDECCIGLPAVQAKDSYSDTYSTYRGSGVTYYVFIKIDGWEDFTFYKKFTTTSLLGYKQYGNKFYYTVNLKEFFGGSVIKGISYSFKAYAVMTNYTNDGFLSTRDNNGEDVKSIDKAFRIANPMCPSINSCKVTNNLIQILGYTPSYNSLDGGHEFEDYEVVVIPDNISDTTPSYSSIRTQTSVLMGADTETRIFRRSSTDMPFSISLARNEDDIPHSGAYLRLDKLTEAGANGIYLGIELTQTSTVSTKNETFRLNETDVNSTFWYHIEFDTQLEEGYSFYADSSKLTSIYHHNYTNIDDHFLYLGNILNDHVIVDNSYALLFRPGDSTFYFDLSSIIEYSGVIEFELRLSFLNYVFKSSTPRFDIDINQYLNYFVSGEHIRAFITASYSGNTIFFTDLYIEPAGTYAPVSMIISDQFYYNEQIKGQILAVGKNYNDMPVCSIKVDYVSNFAINYPDDNNEYTYTILKNKYINKVCNFTVTNTSTGKSYTVDDSYTTTGRDLVIYEIPLSVGTNNFSYTITDPFLGLTVSSGTLSYIYSDNETSNNENKPLLSLNRSTRTVCVNSFADNDDIEDYTLYVEGTLAVKGQIYYGHDGDVTYVGSSFMLGDRNGYLSTYYNTSFVIDTSTTEITISDNFPIRKTDFQMVSVYIFPDRSGHVYEIFYQDGSRAKIMYRNNLYTSFYQVDKYGNEVEL